MLAALFATLSAKAREQEQSSSAFFHFKPKLGLLVAMDALIKPL